MPRNWNDYRTDGHLTSQRKVDIPHVTARVHGLPDHVDLRRFGTRVEDQGMLGSCVANAFVSGLEFGLIRSGQPVTDLSRLFVYYNGRMLSGTQNYDAGMLDHHAMAAIVAYGVCPESAWPYDVRMHAMRPHDQCYAMASSLAVMQFARVADAQTLKSALAAGIPVSCGISLPNGWLQEIAPRERELRAPTGGWPAPAGSHTMLIVGYDDRRRAWLFRNSWGADWADQGHVWIAYEVFDRYQQPGVRWAIGQISTAAELSVSGPSMQETASQVRAQASEEMSEVLAARKSALQSDIAGKLAAERSGIRDRLRSATPGAPQNAGPGAGGGYNRNAGPGAGGGYDRARFVDDGTGAGSDAGAEHPVPPRNDGPGAGGGY